MLGSLHWSRSVLYVHVRAAFSTLGASRAICTQRHNDKLLMGRTEGQARTGSSNRPTWLIRQTYLASSGVIAWLIRQTYLASSGVIAWLIRQTYLASSGVIGIRGPLQIICPSRAPFWPRVPGPIIRSPLSRNILRGGPPSRRTNRPTWQVPGCQAAQSAPAEGDGVFSILSVTVCH